MHSLLLEDSEEGLAKAHADSEPLSKALCAVAFALSSIDG